MSVFSDVDPIRYEGPQTENEFAYRAYDKDRLVLGRRMEDWLRPAVCFWHSFSSSGNDMFGTGTLYRPWLDAEVTPEMAEQRLDAAFDFMVRLGVPFFTFHDADVLPTVRQLPEYKQRLREMEEAIAIRMESTGLRLLWGTANLFTHPRYAAGAATNPDPEVFAYAAAQVRACLETTHRLGGENYVLWGGREGYDTLLNTDLSRELDHYARFLTMVVEHKYRIGFEGAILIEPKPFEPTKHQYDRDVATVYAFLQRYGLEKEIKVNIEVNHATLAGLDFEHEVAVARMYGILGSIDINRGDPRVGWDTDQFPNNAQELVPAMLQVIENGGLGTGGFNFDAKVRRQSVDPADLYLAHICGVDTLARALLSAAEIIESAQVQQLRKERYEPWNSDLGRRIEEGKLSLSELADYAEANLIDPKPRSGKQELLESIVARHCRY